jgi:hypothetical protein
MRVVFVLSLTIGVSETLFSQSTIDSVRTDLNNFYPGAANDFYQWGVEETTIDQIAETVRLLNSTNIHPTPYPLVPTIHHANMLAFFVLYKNPVIDGNIFLRTIGHLFRASVVGAQFRPNGFLMRARSLAIAPDWFHSTIWSAVATDIRVSIEEISLRVKQVFTANPRLRETLPQAARSSAHIHLSVKIWYSYCVYPAVAAGRSRPYYCRYIPTKKIWIMRQIMQESLHRNMLLKIHHHIAMNNPGQY